MMEFKDCLRELMEANGGMTAQNIMEIAQRIRKIKPDVSPQYFQALLRGQPPTDDERWAISQVLEPESERWMSRIWRLEDDERRRVAKYAYSETQNEGLATAFVDFVLAEASFRDGELPESELGILFSEFRSVRSLEDEIDLFELKV